MQIVYAQKNFSAKNDQRSIFLAGPTPRSLDVPSWRLEALEILRQLLFSGTVFVPEDKGGGMSGNKTEQVKWEWLALSAASQIVFWVPRDIRGGMPAFTTNVEFGMFVESGKAILGYPESADKVSYLHFHADRVGMPVAHDLATLLAKAITRLS